MAKYQIFGFGHGVFALRRDSETILPMYDTSMSSRTGPSLINNSLV